MRRTIFNCLFLALACFLNRGMLADNLKVQGLVMDRVTRSPLVGATVSATGGQATRDAVTDSDGIFLLPLQQEIKPGAVVRIRVYKEGYEQYEKQEPASAEVPLTIFLSPTKGTRDVEVKLIFKATPLFTPRRKRLITAEISELYAYFRELGFDLERDLPPLGIRSAEMMSGVFPRTIFDRQINFPAKSIDDGHTIRGVYADYVFRTLLVLRDLPAMSAYDEHSAAIFSAYYVGSFEERKPRWNEKWVNAIWGIRQQLGKDFADKLLLYAFKTWAEPGKEQSFDEFFSVRLHNGQFVLDNAGEHEETIDKVMQDKGLYANTPPRKQAQSPEPENPKVSNSHAQTASTKDSVDATVHRAAPANSGLSGRSGGNINLEQKSEGPDSPNIATFGDNSPVNYSPQVNPFAVIDYYDFQGVRRIQQGNQYKAVLGDELSVFQKLQQLEKQEDWGGLRDLALQQIAKTGEKWLTPHLYAGKACVHLDQIDEAIKHLVLVQTKAGGNPQYSEATTILKQLRSK